jgi:TrmH family RNA methyltransferase
MTAPITSRHNERLRELRKLRERKHRDGGGLFAAEGEDLLAAARRAGAEPTAVYYDSDRIDPDDALIAGLPVGTCVPVAAEALESASALGSGSRVIAVFRQRWSDLGRAGDVPIAVYLHEVADPGNVGTLLRSALALAEAIVVLSPGSADPFGPKAVRASMGAVFAQPLARASFDQARAALDGGRRVVGLVPGTGRPLHELGQAERTMFCLGSERAGLPASVMAACDEIAHIPLRSGEAQSLNVAIAATLCLYEETLHRLSS